MGERKEQDEITEIFSRADRRVSIPDDLYVKVGGALNCINESLESEYGGCLVGFPVVPSVRDSVALTHTVLGRLPKSLLQALELERLLIPLIGRNLIPSCPVCRGVAERPVTISDYQLPSDGFIALVIRDEEVEIPLVERCQLLGLERAYVQGRIVRCEGLSAEDGEPVLRLFSVERAAHEYATITDWFARGGGSLVLVHLAKRESQGCELGILSGTWRCSTCATDVAPLSISDIYEAQPCGRCRGEGWLCSDNDRLLACDSCEGFGSCVAITEARLGPVQLRHGATLTAEDLLNSDLKLLQEESQVFQVLCAVGLGRYPLGAPLGSLSSVDRMLLAFASARISKISGLIFAVDAPAVGSFGTGLRSIPREGPDEPALVLYEPSGEAPMRTLPHAIDRGCVELRDVCIGPLEEDQLSFPVGAASLVQASASSLGTVLFQEIQRRFAQRRKLSQVCNFGDINRCELVDCSDISAMPLLAVLGLEGELARELARSRQAQELGFSAHDLDLSKGENRCRECLAQGRSFGRELCQTCRGALYGWRLMHLPIGSYMLKDIMVGSLDEALKALWANDSAEAVLSRVPSEMRSRLSLATLSSEIPPAELRFLRACGALARVSMSVVRSTKKVAQRGSRSLLLLQDAFATSLRYQEVVLDLMSDALQAGATIVCSEAPPGLETCFSSVLCFAELRVDPKERLRSRFLDRRLSRWMKSV